MSAPAPTLLRLPEVLRRVGLSRAEVYRRVGTGQFPRPCKIGGPRASAWVESEVAKFVADCIAGRDSDSEDAP